MLAELPVQNCLLVIKICIVEVLQQKVGIEVFGGEDQPAEVPGALRLSLGLSWCRLFDFVDEGESQLGVMSLHLTLLLKHQELQEADLGLLILAEDVESVINELTVRLNIKLRLHKELGSLLLVKFERDFTANIITSR